MDTSRFRQQSTSRDQVLVAYAAGMVARTALTQDDFAQELAAAVHRLSPAKAAAKDVPDFEALTLSNDTRAFVRASGNWQRRVSRWLSGEVDFPSWLEEPWVEALQGEFQEQCLLELAHRYGLSGARVLEAESGVAVFGRLVMRLGRTVEIGSVILSDGQIDASDAALLPAFVEQLRAAEARCRELRAVAEQSMHSAGGAA